MGLLIDIGRTPFTPPPPGDRPDPLGLPPVPGLLSESPEERARRLAQWPALVGELYRRAVADLGEAKARSLFSSITKRPHGHRGEAKNLDPDRDRLLLATYDQGRAEAECLHEMKRLPRLISERFHDHEPHRYGNSAKAIETRLRSLLNTRKKTRAETEGWFQRWREDVKRSTGKYPHPGLLSATEPEE